MIILMLITHKNNNTMNEKKSFLEPRVCKNPDCRKEHDGVNIARSSGEWSTIYLLGYCSARCYTKDVVENSSKSQPKTIKVPIKEFIKNGGTLHEGRKIYGTVKDFPIAEYLRFDDKLQVHLGKNASYKSFPLTESADSVEIEVKPIYK